MTDLPIKLAYDVQEFCELLGIARQTFYDELTAGRIKTFCIGKRRKISRQAALDYIAARERETGATV